MPWIDCKVARAGPAENGTIHIALKAKDNSFREYFVAEPAMERKVLATAISTGRDVSSSLTSTTAFSTIDRLYVHG